MPVNPARAAASLLALLLGADAPPVDVDPAGGPAQAAPAASTPATTAPPSGDDEAAASSMLQEARARMAVGDFAEVRRLAGEVAQRYPTTVAGPSAVKLLAQVAIVGQPAPTLAVQEWFQGVGFIPARGSVLLVFFESWCPHCVQEAPHVATIAANWRLRGLKVIGLTKVSRSATPDTVRAMMQAANWTFPVGREQDGAVSLACGVNGIPAAVLVRDGVVVWVGHPASLSDDTLKHLLK